MQDRPGGRKFAPAVGDELTIEQVSRLLGLPASTIRSWERRYCLPLAGRTVGGHRRYTPDQLRLLMRMQELVANGRRVAGAAAQVAAEVAAPPSVRIANFLQAALTLRPDTIAEVLDASEQALGLGPTVDKVVLPAFRQLGAWWQETGSRISHEHLATQTTQTWLARAGSAVPDPDRPPVVLCCGPGDSHTLALEALTALLRTQGCDCRLLGARTPAPALVEAVRDSAAPAVVVVSHLPTGRTAAVQSLRAAGRVAAHLFYAGGAFASPQSRQLVPGRYLGDNLTRAAELVGDVLRPPDQAQR